MHLELDIFKRYKIFKGEIAVYRYVSGQFLEFKKFHVQTISDTYSDFDIN